MKNILQLSFGAKIGLGKTVLPRFIRQNTKNKVVLDVDAVTDATNFNNPTVIIDLHLEDYNKSNETL
jgi:hypothetical protein